jgi:hypothetical protein
VTRALRPQLQGCANRIENEEQHDEFVACMIEADRLHTRATELRRNAWAIYRSRDDEKFA